MTNSQLRKHRHVFAHHQWNRHDPIKEISRIGSMNVADMINKILSFARLDKHTSPIVINRGARNG